MKFEQELKELNKNLELRVKKEVEKQKQQEILLIQQTKMSTVGEILSAIIHQWKQPMTAISYLIQDMADRAENDKLTKQYSQNISEEALQQINYMNKTVDDFRKFLMPSNSKEVFNVVNILIATIKMLVKQIEKDNLDVNITIINDQKEVTAYDSSDIADISDTNTSMTCFDTCGYPNEFQQVLMNIIYNARDAIQLSENSAGERGRINLMVTSNIEKIEIAISDNAGGIPENVISRIFEPYFTTKSQKGTGIGLYMAKSIIENHMDGTIAAHNTDTGGALFNITLKQYPVN